MKKGDIILFLKHNEKFVRKSVGTDYYTEQNYERLFYNCNKLIENYLKIVNLEGNKC